MKKLISLIIAVVLLVSLAVPVLAVSDTSTAQYRATIIVSNNSTAISGVATILSANTSAWQDVGYINSSCNNTAMLSSGSDVYYMPGYGGNPWAIWVSDIGTYSYQTNLLYMGGAADMGGYIQYFPGTAGMTTSDNATDNLELSDNFTYSAKGWLDTTNGTDKYILNKTGAIDVLVSPTVSGTVIATIYGSENLSTYTEVDPNNKLTVTALKALAAQADRDENVYLYKDKDANFFDALDIDFEIYIASTSDIGGQGGMAISNTVSTIKGFAVTDVSVIARKDDVTVYVIGLYRGYLVATDSYTCAANTLYYCTLSRTAGSNIITCLIYSDADRAVSHLLDTLSVADYSTTKYRYIYGFVNNNTPVPNQNFNGYVQNIFTHRNDPVVSATGLSSAEQTVNVAMKSPFFGIGVDNTTALLPVTDSLVVNAPLWQTECSTDPFTTVDSNAYSFNPSGATWSSSGYVFDGNDLIDGGDQTLLRPGSQSMTFIIWINPTNFADDRGLFSKGDVTANLAGSYHIYLADTNVLRVWYQSSTIKSFAPSVPAGSWTQITIVCNHSNDSITVYQNGNQVGSPSSDTWSTSNARTDQFYIGANDLGGATDYFLGTIGEARVYNKAFSLTEVQQDYNATAWKYTGATDRAICSTLTSVPNTLNPMVSFQNGVMPYVEYQRIYIDGIKQQDIQWEYGATFHNSAHGGDDATPTFRTTTSDADVTTALSVFAPMTVARAPAFAVSEAPLFYTAPITTAGNFTSTTVPAGGPPGSAVIEEAAAAGGTPSIWIWGILAICVLAAIGLFISWMERKYGSGGGSLMLRVIVGVVVFGMLIAWGKFDFWMLVLYLMVEAALLMMSRQGEIGGNVSQYGLIGFLAQSWMGLTIINRIMEKQFITGNEQLWANYFAFTQEFKLLGLFNIPVINFQFFTYGLPSLLNWGEYSFFGGNAQMFEYLLYTLTAVVSFIMFGMVIGLLYNAIRVG